MGIFSKDFNKVMENNKEFLLELSIIMKDVLSWSQADKIDYNFDIDNILYFLSKKFDKKFDDFPLYLIYNLLDFYCDAVKHNLKDIQEGYHIIDIREDIKLIIKEIENGKFEQIKLNSELLDRMIKLNS